MYNHAPRAYLLAVEVRRNDRNPCLGLELQMILSPHLGAVNGSQNICKNNNCSWPMSLLSFAFSLYFHPTLKGFSFIFFLRLSHFVGLTGLELAMEIILALHSQTSHGLCLLLSPRIKVVYHHT